MVHKVPREHCQELRFLSLGLVELVWWYWSIAWRDGLGSEFCTVSGFGLEGLGVVDVGVLGRFKQGGRKDLTGRTEGILTNNTNGIIIINTFVIIGLYVFLNHISITTPIVVYIKMS